MTKTENKRFGTWAFFLFGDPLVRPLTETRSYKQNYTILVTILSIRKMRILNHALGIPVLAQEGTKLVPGQVPKKVPQLALKKVPG